MIREVAGSAGTQYGIAMTAADIYTLAGRAGSTGYSASAGPAIDAQLDSPDGIAVDTAGDLYVVDDDNYVIRAIAAGSSVAPTVSLSCPSGTDSNSGTLTCTVTADPRAGVGGQTVATVGYTFEHASSNSFSGITDVTTDLAVDGNGV